MIIENIQVSSVLNILHDEIVDKIVYFEDKLVLSVSKYSGEYDSDLKSADIVFSRIRSIDDDIRVKVLERTGPLSYEGKDYSIRQFLRSKWKKQFVFLDAYFGKTAVMIRGTREFKRGVYCTIELFIHAETMEYIPKY